MNKPGWQLPDDDPMVRERAVVHSVYAALATTAVCVGIWLAIGDVAHDLFPPTAAEIVLPTPGEPTP